MLDIEKIMLKAGLPLDQVELLLRLFDIPFAELPAGWFEEQSKNYELASGLLSKRVRSHLDGRLDNYFTMGDRSLEKVSGHPVVADYSITTNQNQWTSDIVEIQVALEDDDPFSKKPYRKCRLNRDQRGGDGREAFLNSILPHWFDEKNTKPRPKVIIVLPVDTGENTLDGTWVNFQANSREESVLGGIKIMAAMQLLDLSPFNKSNLLGKTLLHKCSPTVRYLDKDAFELDANMIKAFQCMGLAPADKRVMYFKFSKSMDLGGAALEKYQRPNPEYAGEDIAISRDNLMQLFGRGSGVVISFDKNSEDIRENSILIMPRKCVHIANSSRRTTRPNASGSEREGGKIKSQALYSFEEGLGTAEVLHVIEIRPVT